MMPIRYIYQTHKGIIAYFILIVFSNLSLRDGIEQNSLRDIFQAILENQIKEYAGLVKHMHRDVEFDAL